MTRHHAALGAALVGLVLLGACGTVERAGTPLPREVAAPRSASGGEALDPELTTAVVPGLGAVLSDGEGLTLYRFDGDTARPPASTCEGPCTESWVPAAADAEAVRAQGVAPELVSTIVRADGARQITVGGWPVYRFAGDTAPGQAGGQGADGTWFAAAPDGKKAVAPASGLALTTASVGDLGTVLTDAGGMTLYRFDEDSPDPSRSTCEGGCAEQWPPLLVEPGGFEVQGVDRALVGTTTRADGELQVTAAGWPLYRFAGDRLCGEAKGHGVGGTWFAAAPDGGRAGG
ncbi:hypothetical protein [Saccharothrix xinjiangensis]|uniref:Lipoprotein with Yx(FWY)xxD motif n=1 Tax=Saccharothrix xinjiangensis TaxID=204798 RepID=A0ABV9XPN3_9PSEU